MTQRISVLMPETRTLYMKYFLAYANGKTIPEIAKELYVTERAIKYAFTRLRQVYNAKHTTHLLKIIVNE